MSEVWKTGQFILYLTFICIPYIFHHFYFLNGKRSAWFGTVQINRNAYCAIFKATRCLSPFWFGFWFGVLLLLLRFGGGGAFGDVGKRGIKGSKINVSQSSKLMSQLETHFPSPTTLVAEATHGWHHSWSSIWFCFPSLFLSLTNFGTAQIFLVLRKQERFQQFPWCCLWKTYCNGKA